MTRADIRELPAAWPSCTLGGWGAAWIAGACSPDHVIGALTASAAEHVIDDHTDETAHTGVLGLLAMIRGAEEMIVRLPGAGDPAGLPPAPATTAAFAAGEVLVVGDAVARSGGSGPLALIPSVVGSTPLSGIDDLVCRWAVFRYPQPLDVGVLGSGGPSAGDLEYELRQSVRDAAELFAGLGGGARAAAVGDLRARLAALTLRHQVPLPPAAHDDARAARLVDSAARIEAIVDLARAQSVAIGETAGHLDAVDTEFRRLAGLARTARAAAVNATIAELLRSSR